MYCIYTVYGSFILIAVSATSQCLLALWEEYIGCFYYQLLYINCHLLPNFTLGLKVKLHYN